MSESRASIESPRAPAERQEYVPLSDADGNGTPDWQDELARGGIGSLASSSGSFSTSSDPLSAMGSALTESLIGGYLSLKEADSYTPERGELLASTIASNLRAPTIFVPHTRTELVIDTDTSQVRILEYRADMREALAPMVDIEAEPEFSLFARFIQTGDILWLEKLSEVAVRYRQAENSALAVEIPVSATESHLRVVNALGKYTETLERLVRFANDPLALMALLRTYNEAEREMFLAFDALAKFYVQEVAQK